jgi:hypothetical protein
MNAGDELKTLAEDRRSYLGFIQATITRLSGASFQLKGWSVALGTVVIGLTAKDNRSDLAWIAILPAVAFWVLDGYYLALEYNYRVLFNEAVSGGKALFDMKSRELLFGDWLSAMLRPSVFPIHLVIVVIALLVMWHGPRAAVGP